MYNFKQLITKAGSALMIAGMISAVNPLVSYAGRAIAIAGQTTVLSSTISQDLCDEPNFDSALTNFQAGTAAPSIIEDFDDDMCWEHILERDLYRAGVKERENFGMDIKKDKKCLNYGEGDKDYIIWLYTSEDKNASAAFKSVCAKAQMYACYNEEYSDSDDYPDLKKEMYGVTSDYYAKLENMQNNANNVLSVVHAYINRLMDVEAEVETWEFKVTDEKDFQPFPESFEDIIYVSLKDYGKLCPWYDKYIWKYGKTYSWGGTDDEAKAVYSQYGKSDYVDKSYVNELWRSLTGKSHQFLKYDIFSRYFLRRNEEYQNKYGYREIKDATYDSNITGYLRCLVDTELPTKGYNERIKDSYTNAKDKEKKYSYHEAIVETTDTMVSNWEVAADAMGPWKTIATGVSRVESCTYEVAGDTLTVNSKRYNMSEILPDHGRIIYVRRVVSCGNVFWKGSVTSPALRIRPFLTLDGLDVYTNKSIVEGGYLDPKDIIVIAHYNTGDTVMSGKGDYIAYPGETNLRITLVGTNYVYYVYTDPQLGDIVRGYFQVKGLEKTPLSVTAEYVGDPVVEKTDYEASGLRVNVTFNNGSTDTFTAESANVGTYKIKSYGRGDIDANGVLNNTDVTLLRSIVSGETATNEQKIQADVNKDGIIDTEDITSLQNIVSKTVTQIGSNTFYAAFSGLKLSNGSPVYARFTVPGIKKSPYSVSVVQDPEKLHYIEGEDFDPTGMTLKVLYDNGEYTFITYEDKRDSFDGVEFGDDDHPAKSMLAETTVLPITYTENGVTVKTELSLKVSLITLTSVKVTRAPDTTIYYSGETFKNTGMEVTAYFDEGVEGHTPDEIVLTSSEYVMSGYKKMKDSTMNIAFLLDDPTSVSNASGEYLLVATNLLEEGQDFEEFSHGTFKYKDGRTFKGTVCGNYLIKILYTSRGITKSTYQPIWVYDKRPTGLTIVSMPYVTEYIAGQDFNTDGLILRAAYSDGTSSYVYPDSESRKGYIILDSKELSADRGYVIAQYTENATTLQVEIPITVLDPEVDGITASYLGPAVYVGNQFNPKDVQIVVSYTNGSVKSFRANEVNADGTMRVKIVIPEEDGSINPDAAANYTLLHVGMNDFVACYAGFTDMFQVNAISNPSQLDFSNSVAKSKRIYDTWTENFTAIKIRSVADYINGRVELTENISLDEYHVVNGQKTTDTRENLTFEEGTGQGINLESTGTVSPLLSFLREGAWRQPETVISIDYKGRTKGFLYPELTNPLFAQKYNSDLRYIQEHEQFYDTPRNELQNYVDEGWSDWVTNGDSTGTVLANRVAYNYTTSGDNPASETMYLDRLKIRLSNVEAGNDPILNVTVRNSNGVETVYNNIQEDDVILDPCQIKIELAGTINVVDNYGVTVSKPFGDVYKIFYRATTDDAAGWSSEGEWAGYSGVNMECLEIKLMLEETDFNTGTVTNAPVINRQPKNVSVKIGGNATFSVLAIGNDLYYQWYCNGVAIPGGNDQVYATPELKLEDDGNIYYCMIIADNGTGLSTKSSAVSVSVRDTSPVLTKDLQERYDGKVGDEVEFEIQAYCLDTSNLQYEWQITQNGNYVPLAGGDSNKITLNVTADMHGEYIRCHVTNTQGACNSNPCLITCIGAPIVTINSSEPTAYVNNSRANVITFSASVESDAPGTKTYEWAFDGITKNSATGDSTTWIPTSLGSHTITCTVTDSLGGRGIGTYTIYVGEKPSVTVTTKTVKDADGNITITAIASLSSYDTANAKFEWTYDGVSIAGQSDITESEDHKTITISNAVAGNHSIALKITDGFGTASSLSAVVAN